METKNHSNVRDAIKSLTAKDKNYVFVRHVLESGEKIKPHYHEKANEWILIDNGKFTVKVGNEEKNFDIKNGVLTILFPKGQVHFFLAKVKVSYFVFRDCTDRIIYTGGKK